VERLVLQKLRGSESGYHGVAKMDSGKFLVSRRLSASAAEPLLGHRRPAGPLQPEALRPRGAPAAVDVMRPSLPGARCGRRRFDATT
jgi:hypothetical protein